MLIRLTDYEGDRVVIDAGDIVMIKTWNRPAITVSGDSDIFDDGEIIQKPEAMGSEITLRSLADQVLRELYVKESPDVIYKKVRRRDEF